MDLFVQTAGSMVAILALAGLAWWLKLGGAPRLDDEAAVRRAADEIEDGFVPVTVACDVHGDAALARDSTGRVMAIRRHGNRFAGRLLGPDAKATLMVHTPGVSLVVDPGEARFGKVSLAIPDAQAWADAINRVTVPQDA